MIATLNPPLHSLYTPLYPRHVCPRIQRWVHLSFGPWLQPLDSPSIPLGSISMDPRPWMSAPGFAFLDPRPWVRHPPWICVPGSVPLDPRSWIRVNTLRRPMPELTIYHHISSLANWRRFANQFHNHPTIWQSTGARNAFILGRSPGSTRRPYHIGLGRGNIFTDVARLKSLVDTVWTLVRNHCGKPR